jgi:hypothetical protein
MSHLVVDQRVTSAAETRGCKTGIHTTNASK